MNQPKKVVVFLSGRGTNFKTIIAHQNSLGEASPFRIVRAVCNKPGAPGLFYAKDNNIPYSELFRADHDSLDNFKRALCEDVIKEDPDIIVLAGFMLVVPEWFVDQYYGKIINIHPSLLPDYPGLETHTRVLQDKKTVHGCTVHLVDKGIDTGAVIAQAKLDVMPGESAIELAARVLVFEHKIYPWVVHNIATGDITIKNGTCSYTDKVKDDAKQRGFSLP